MGMTTMEHEFKGGPWLGGWLIAAGVGAVALGLCLVVGQFDLTPAVAIAGVMFLLTGIVLSWFASTPVSRTISAPISPAVEARPAPVMAAPVMAEAPAKAAAAKPAAVMAAATPGVARKPDALKTARGGKADDLKIIKGIGPKLEILCHKLGFFHFDQVAGWTADEIAWVDENLEGFKGRVTRDRWVPQAKAIVALGPVEFLAQLDAGKEF
jgi:predicted flap endonuclease-1-like 5' DNA nuclease